MFIAWNAAQKIFAPLGAKSGSGTNAEAGKDGSAPTELRTKERITSYSLLFVANQYP